MNVSNVRDGDIHSHSIDKILSDEEEETSDANQQQQLNNSDEDLFNLSTQPIEQIASTSNSIYDKETQPITFSSPFKTPLHSISQCNKIRPSKGGDCVMPVMSIYEMETQDIGFNNANVKYGVEVLPPCRLNLRDDEKNELRPEGPQNNNTPIEDIHLAATQKLFPESSLLSLGVQLKPEEDYPETQAFEFCPDISTAPTQPLEFQNSHQNVSDDSDCQTPPVSPRICVPYRITGKQNISKNTSQGKESDEETPPSSPVLNLSSSSILNSTHRSDDFSVFDRTEDEQFIPETQQEEGEQCIPETQEEDEPTQKLYPMLNFPSSQSSTSSDMRVEVDQDHGTMEESHIICLSSSPVLDLLMTPVKASNEGIRSITLTSSTPSFDFQRSPAFEVEESEIHEPTGNTCDSSGPTQLLNVNSDVSARSKHPQSLFVDPFAPTQRLVISPESEEESLALPMLCKAIDEDSADISSFAPTQLIVRSESPVLFNMIDKENEGINPFDPTQKLIVRSESPVLLNDGSADADPFEPTQKLIVRSLSPILSNATNDGCADADPFAPTQLMVRSESPVLFNVIDKENEGINPFDPTQKLIVRSESPVLSSTSDDGSADADPFAPTQKLIVRSESPVLPSKSDDGSADVDPFAPTQLIVRSESPVLPNATNDGSADADPFAPTQKLYVRRASEEERRLPIISTPPKITKSKVIIRRSDEVSLAVRDGQANRSSTALQDPVVEQQLVLEADAETDTDFEMTFSGSQTSTVTSPEPFRGFSLRDMQESCRHFQKMHKIIDVSEAEESNEDNSSQSSNPARFLDFGTDYVEPGPILVVEVKKEVVNPEPEPQPIAEPEPVRRSGRKRLPNTRLTEGEMFQLNSTVSRRSTRSSASSDVAPPKKSRNSTITLVTSTPSSSTATKSGRGRKKAVPVLEPLVTPPVVKTEPCTSEETVQAALKPTKRRGRSNINTEDIIPLKEIKREPKTETASPAGNRTSQRLPSMDGDDGAVVRVDVDPVPLPSPIPVRRGRPPKVKVKVEVVNQSMRSARSRSSSLDTTVSSTTNAASKSTRRRKRALAGKVLVLFTGFDDESDRLIVQQLGKFRC